MNEYTKSQAHINSIIGEGTRFQGDIELQGLLRIDGDFKGSIKTVGRVLIGRFGRVQCLIEADTVVVGGILKGDIRAESKVVLLSTAMMIGDIRSPQIIVEERAIIHGHCTVSRDAAVLAAAPSREDEQFSVDWGNRGNRSAAAAVSSVSR